MTAPRILSVTEFHDAGWRATGDRAALYGDPTTPARKEKLRRALAELPAGAPVLDFGCGRGEFTTFLAALGFRPTGVDLAPSVTELNCRDFPDLDFATAATEEPLPFADQTFAAIWASEVVEHVYDVHGTFAEFARLLMPRGRLIVTTPYHGRLKNLLLALFAFDKHFNVEWQHIRFWTKRSLAKVAGDHGLHPIVWDHVGRVRWLAKSFFVVFEKRQR